MAGQLRPGPFPSGPFPSGPFQSAPFRLGLVGAGRMGQTHLRALAGSSRVAVVAVADPAPLVGESLAAAGLPVYPSVAELVDRCALDGVLIAAPTDRHLQVVAEVAAAGLPILCEKPCGLGSAQAAAAAGEAARAGVPLQVAYWRRYVPALRVLRDRMLGGDLGGIHLVSCCQWDQEPPPAAFRAHSGGIFIDMGVHEFDQLRWLTGQEIGALHAVAASLVADPAVHGDVDSAEVVAELSRGAVGLVSLGRHHPPGDLCRAEVFGTGGAVRCDFLDPVQGDQVQKDALRRQAEDFAAMAGGAACSGATGADAIAALEAAERATAAVPALAGAGVSAGGVSAGGVSAGGVSAGVSAGGASAAAAAAAGPASGR